VIQIPLAIGIAMAVLAALSTALVLIRVQLRQNEKARSERETLTLLAERDCLTGLYNRTAACRRIEQYMMTRSSEEQGALLLIDLDNFKEVNDHFGHLAGDAVLMEIGRLLLQIFRASDIVSRIGGDEFIIFMTGVTSPQDSGKKAEEIVRSLAASNAGLQQAITCSIGIALYPLHGDRFETLFAFADSAMYQAKDQGKNSVTLCQKQPRHKTQS